MKRLSIGILLVCWVLLMGYAVARTTSAPAPALQILLSGHPQLRSNTAGRRGSSSEMTADSFSGSAATSCMAAGCSSGSMTAFLYDSLAACSMPLTLTISVNTSPASNSRQIFLKGISVVASIGARNPRPSKMSAVFIRDIRVKSTCWRVKKQ